MPLKITFVLPSLIAGGAERVLITLLNGLDRAKYAPELITLNNRGIANLWLSENVPHRTLTDKNILSGLPGLLRLLRQSKPDIVITAMAHMNMALLLLRPFLGDTRIIVREANLISAMEKGTRFPTWVRKAYQFGMRLGYRLLYPCADLVIAPAQCILDEFRTYLHMKSGRFALLYNPVDVARTRNGEPLSTHADGATVHFVSVGRLRRSKGFDRMIEALSNFQSDHPWHYTIYGEGSERGKLEALIAAHNLADRVTLSGAVENPSRFVAAADALLLPSRWEGLPNVVLESLSAGTPVIASSEAGGVTEIAALAPQHVAIANDMTEFVSAMRAVKPAPVVALRPSLLPLQFDEPAILARLECLLDDLLIAPAVLNVSDIDKAALKTYPTGANSPPSP